MTDHRIIGTWRLRSTKAVDDDGNTLPPPLGPMPNGVVCFQADGRMYSIICDGRAHLWILQRGRSRMPGFHGFWISMPS